MSKQILTPPQIRTLIKSFKSTLIATTKRRYNHISQTNYYQNAKKAQTQQRNLIKALQLYIKAFESKDKIDSSIKDFASSLHQLGYTKEAVRLMDQCEKYYAGNIEKYWRLRDNLQIQIIRNGTSNKNGKSIVGKHDCKSLLLQNFSFRNLMGQNEALAEQNLKKMIFKHPQRIKSMKFFKDIDLEKQPIAQLFNSSYILVQFQSFSAAKKTLQSFNFEQYFGYNIYWINSKTMRVTCQAIDGKNDFEQKILINQQLLQYKKQQQSLKQQFWYSFGIQKYLLKETNGFLNLLSLHLINQTRIDKNNRQKNKQNIFESSKINNSNNDCYYQGNRNHSYLSKDSINHYQNPTQIYFYNSNWKIHDLGVKDEQQSNYYYCQSQEQECYQINSIQNENDSIYSNLNQSPQSTSYKQGSKSLYQRQVHYQINGVLHKRKSNKYLMDLEY